MAIGTHSTAKATEARLEVTAGTQTTALEAPPMGGEATREQLEATGMHEAKATLTPEVSVITTKAERSEVTRQEEGPASAAEAFTAAVVFMGAVVSTAVGAALIAS